MKKQKGITLIALVITIIVLLILAGITINLTIGQDGILKRAQDAGKNYTNAAEYEQTQLAEFTNTADKIIEGLTSKTLVSQIKPADYGKSINYSVTVKNADDEDITLTDWKVFYNDGTNVYIILGDYLNNTLIDTTKTKMTTTGTYQAYWTSESVADNTEAVATLTNTENWSQFATGRGAQSAIGSPTGEMFVASWNANPNTNTKTLTVGTTAGGLTDSTGLYILYTSEEQGYYWLASPGYDTEYVWFVGGFGRAYSSSPFNNDVFGVRPVVCLQSSLTGAVGDAVTID
ncbi:MAG: prepilin-type N-terminal cleavage/methylation domain-containing protein [Clostridia bacterium]|nr:prepilin-type N-terminal cleavage/methylation domain-containing protein [Clostridia bacterium]